MSSSPTAPSSAESAPIPIALPVAQDGPITFANAPTQVKRIPATAWQRVQDTIEANAAFDVPTNIIIGPHTPTTSSEIAPLLNKSFRLWDGFRQPPRFNGIVYSAADEAWAEAQWPGFASAMSTTISPSNYIDKIRAGCQFENDKATSCYGGMAQTFPGVDDGFAFFGVEGNFWSARSLRKNGPRGPISQVVHEYTHNVQFAQWLGTSLKPGENTRSDSAHRGMPCWFSEGQANAIGITVASPDAATYASTRLDNVTRRINANMPVKPSLTKFNKASLKKFLTGQDPLTCYDPGSNGDYQLGFSVGFAATEVLVAIGGPQSTMALLARTSTGETWVDAFESVYGVTWDQGADVIAAVLAAEYKAHPIQR